VIVAAWGLNAIGTMRISYCQNIKRSALTVLKVQCLFHRCSGLVSWPFCWFYPRGASFLAVARMCFLWAKAEVVAETRQVFRSVGIAAPVGFFLRIGAAKRSCCSKL